jgi:glycosyltransferase involved in cell wall biosynthesis
MGLMKVKLPQLSVVIIARDEAENLRRLMPELKWVGQVLVVDNLSQDETKQVVEQGQARYVSSEGQDFAALRSMVIPMVQTEWIFYLDADERVTRGLQEEIVAQLKQGAEVTALSLRRENYFYGQKMTAGGWEKDVVTRIFRRSSLREWQGEIHESPLYDGAAKTLNQALIHLTHRGTAENLAKSSRWTIKEARLLVAAGIPPVTAWTLMRKGVMEWWRRFVWWRGYRDGMVGWVESVVQAFNRVMVYIQVWELQQKPSIEERYQKIERSLQQGGEKSEPEKKGEKVN